MKLKYFFGLLCLLPHTLLAQSFGERARAVYLETDKNFDLECYYSYNKSFKLITPVNLTSRTQNTISRDFKIEANGETLPMNFTVERTGKAVNYRVLFNQKHLSQGKVSRREFYIAPIADKDFAARFETSQIYCHVNFAYAYPHPLEDGTYHFNVHPHKKYDWQSRLKSQIENYLNHPDYRSVIFLETGNYRGNLVNIQTFLDGRPYSLPPTDVDSDLEDVPLDVPLIVSPAGNNRFEMRAEKEINITFSGGNHNYCIWNVTRHVLETLMQSRSKAVVNFTYDTSAIVAQMRGVEKMGLNFNRRDVNRSNLLKDLLVDPETQKRYHAAYLYYFRHYTAREYAGMYKTYTINYQAEGFETTVTLTGTGERDLVVNFKYK